ncbi:MAG: formyltransferase family protein, partial [Candidatus Microthrix parvicella]
MSPRGIVYLGSPPEAVAPLRALVEAGHRVDLVVSAPDRRRRRRGEPTPTPVKAAALELGLKVTDDLADVESAVDEGADLGVVVAFGQLLRLPLLTRLAMVNLHFSLLPRWRGAAPVERALLAG